VTSAREVDRDDDVEAQAARLAGSVTVRLAGDLDLASAAAAWEAIDAAVTRGGRVVIDLAEVTFLDSSGLKVLVAARARAAATGTSLALARPSPATERVLDITGLTDRFDIER